MSDKGGKSETFMSRDEIAAFRGEQQKIKQEEEEKEKRAGLV